MANNYLRQDRRSEAPDDYGKPGVSYPDCSLSFPRIVEEHTYRNSATIPAFKSAHPNGTAYPSAVLWKIIPFKGDNTDRKYQLIYETLPGPILISYEVDSETGSLVEVQKQRVATPTSQPSPPGAGSTTTYTTMDMVVSLKVTRTLINQTGRTETFTKPYAFPRYFDASAPFNPYHFTDNFGNSYQNLNEKLVASKEPDVVHTNVISYSTTEPSASIFETGGAYAVQNWGLLDIIFQGIFFQLNERRVLTNTISETYATGTSGTARWPASLTETASFAASVPSSSQYVALIGTTIVIGGETKIWTAFDLWRTDVLYVTVQ